MAEVMAIEDARALCAQPHATLEDALQAAVELVRGGACLVVLDRPQVTDRGTWVLGRVMSRYTGAALGQLEYRR